MTANRPLTIIEIDVDQCTRTYGSAPCTAALSANTPRKCFNSFRTCQDPENYDRGTLTLRFGENVTGLPKDEGTIFPVLQSVSERPTEINLSGIDPRSTALGKRAKVTVNLLDFTDGDEEIDPYYAERVSGAAQFDAIGYDPNRGRFFARLLARSPYYLGRALRVLRGQVGQPLSAFEVSHYVIDGWDGPNAQGAVSIVAKDPLNLIEGRRALAPAPSSGKLAADIDEAALEFNLEPAGIGDDEYPSEGRLVIGREVMTFTRAGDTVTILQRPVDGSETGSHDAGDTVQVCLRYENQRLDQVAYDLIAVQGPVDSSFIDPSAWEDEVVGIVPGGLTRTLTKPTPIAELIGELCQHGAQIWWDEVAQEIRLRGNRPRLPSETLRDLTDAASLLEGTPSITRPDDRRISTVHFWHGMIDPTDSPTETRNYRRRTTPDDPSSRSTNEYGAARIETIFSPWFGPEGNEAAAAIIGSRLVSRYRNTPRVLTAKLDPKDDVKVGELIEAETDSALDTTGLPERMQMQVRRTVPRYVEIDFEAEELSIVGRFGLIMDADTDTEDYGSATDEEKLNGCYMVDEATPTMPDGTDPYQIF